MGTSYVLGEGYITEDLIDEVVKGVFETIKSKLPEDKQTVEMVDFILGEAREKLRRLRVQL